jgi:hypothetical protein
MKHKMVLAAALAAVAGGVAVSSAEAAPVSGLMGAKQTSDIQTVRYDDYRGHRPWWSYSRRYDNDYRWHKKPWWWKRHHGRDWSSRDYDRRDGDRRRRDW